VAFLQATLALLRLRARGIIDVVQLCQPPDVYFPLALALRWSGARVVLDQRDLMPELLAARYADPPRGVRALLQLLERLSQRSADHTVTVNDHLRARLEATGARHDELSVVWNGPVLSRTTLATPDPALKRGRRHLVVWVGKMGRQDRAEDVVRAAHRLAQVHGRGDVAVALLGDGECLDDLHRLATGLGLDDMVHFTGWVDEETVFTYLATADVGIDTSLQPEVTPVKALEYLAFAVPLVAFDLPETRRLAEGAALLVRPGNVDDVAAAVVRLLDDPGLRQRLGRTGRGRVDRFFAWENQTTTYLTALGLVSDPAEGLGRRSSLRAPRGHP
jgi:glycosyltransferase involved in cell wall biosynthesis